MAFTHARHRRIFGHGLTFSVMVVYIADNCAYVACGKAITEGQVVHNSKKDCREAIRSILRGDYRRLHQKCRIGIARICSYSPLRKVKIAAKQQHNDRVIIAGVLRDNINAGRYDYILSLCGGYRAIAGAHGDASPFDKKQSAAVGY